MNAIQTLLTDHLDLWTAADTEKKSGRGRSSGNAASVYGIRKLRELILELAVRGKLVPQDPGDEPASALLKKIAAEKSRLIAEGKIKKDKPLPAIGDEDKPFAQPPGWEWVRLGMLGEWGAGATPARGNLKYFGGDIPWFKSGELTADYISQSEETVTELALKECSLRANNVGDVLIAMYGATIGKTAILSVPATTNQAVCACTPFNGIANRYLLLLLKALKPNFIGQGAGGAQPNISREKIIATITALPPLEEQHRIVAKVDELMALCDHLEQQQTHSIEAHQTLVETLLGTLTRVESQQEFSEAWTRIASHFDTLFATEASINQLKQTILQLAVVGKLVQQDTNDEPASLLLEKIAEEKKLMTEDGLIKKQIPLSPIVEGEKPLTLPDGWECVRFGTVAVIERGGSPRPINSYLTNDPDGLNWIKIGDTDQGGKYITSTSEKIRREGLSKTRMVYPGDFLLTNSMSFGRPYITKIEGCIHDGWLRISPPNTVDKDYLYLLLSSPYIREAFKVAAAGAVVQNLNADKVRELVIPIPPINEQHRIVAKVDELMALCDALKSRLADAQATQLHLADAIVEQAVC